MERWVCAPQSDPGGIDREPKESDSIRDGSEAMAAAAAASNVEASGRMEERTPGVNVAGAKTCFIIVLLIIVLFYCFMVDW